MRMIASHVRISDEILEEMPEFHIDVENDLFKQLKTAAYNNGDSLTGKATTRSGVSGDDFVANMLTIVMRIGVQKCPRIANQITRHSFRSMPIRGRFKNKSNKCRK